MAIGSGIQSKGTETVTLTGTDRLFHVPDVSSFSDGKVELEEVITPTSFKRLDTVASAFQRIRYRTLRFEIIPSVSTATSGGYVACFMKDATDHVSGGEAGLQKMTAQKGAITSKWWESAEVLAVKMPDLYYTSAVASETGSRWSSPGRFVLACDGRATQKGSLTVYAHWTVELSEPSLENAGDGVDDTLVTLEYPLYTQGGSDNIYSRVGENEKDNKANASYVDMQTRPGTVYKLAGMRYMSRNLNNAFDGLTGFHYIINESNKIYPYDPTNKTTYKDMSYKDTEVALKGEQLQKITGNLRSLRGSEYLSRNRRHESLEDLIETFQVC